MEMVTNGKQMLFTQRSLPEPIGRPRELTPAQLRWLEQKHPGIFRNRVERVEAKK